MDRNPTRIKTPGKKNKSMWDDPRKVINVVV
jgi:hypothetical protein